MKKAYKLTCKNNIRFFLGKKQKVTPSQKNYIKNIRIKTIGKL